MFAKKCDRCGRLYEIYNKEKSSDEINGVQTLNIDEKGMFFSHKPIDLCPDCKDSFKNWLEAVKEDA